MGQQIYTTGSGNFAAVPDVTSYDVHAQAPGGGGACVFSIATAGGVGGGGGGGGAYAFKAHTGLVGNIAYVVGMPGARSNAGHAEGYASTNTTFVNASTHKAECGSPGAFGAAASAPGGQTSNSIGDIKFAGGTGVLNSANHASGGGGGAGSTGAGANSTSAGNGGAGGAGGTGSPAGGNGGNSGQNFDSLNGSWADAGSPGGGGGSGAPNGNGGPDGQYHPGGLAGTGRLQIDWIDIPPKKKLNPNLLTNWNAVRRSVSRMIGREATLEDCFPFLHAMGNNFGTDHQTHWDLMNWLYEHVLGLQSPHRHAGVWL